MAPHSEEYEAPEERKYDHTKAGQQSTGPRPGEHARALFFPLSSLLSPIPVIELDHCRYIESLL